MSEQVVTVRIAAVERPSGFVGYHVNMTGISVSRDAYVDLTLEEVAEHAYYLSNGEQGVEYRLERTIPPSPDIQDQRTAKYFNVSVEYLQRQFPDRTHERCISDEDTVRLRKLLDQNYDRKDGLHSPEICVCDISQLVSV